MATRTRTVETSQEIGGDARIEDDLRQKGVTWSFLAEVAVEKFDPVAGQRNQVRFNAIDDNRVEQYTEAMKRGDVFPPVIAHKVGAKYVVATATIACRARSWRRRPSTSTTSPGPAPNCS